MGRLTRSAITLVFSLYCAGFCPLANSQENPQNKTIKKAMGSVSGRVTIKGKGKGGIVVGVRPGNFASQMVVILKGTTDPDGNYRIGDVPAGNYQVVPMAPSLIVSDINSFGRQGKSLILAEGENVEGVDFSMLRGGVITGKVTQAEGRPVIEERVSVVLAEQPTDGRPPIIQTSSAAVTDDRGVYRVFGLPAGRYKISLGQSPDAPFGGLNPGRPAYERIFYPDVTNPDEAKVVELAEGGEATNIDITVGQSLTRFVARGVIVDGETTRPLANVRVALQKVMEGNASFVGASTLSDRVGEFRFDNLMTGKYAVVMMPHSDMRSDPVPFELVDQDINGLVLKTSKGSSVSGIMVFEGSRDKAVQAKIAQLRLYAYVRSNGNSGFSQYSAINPDGSFRIGGLQPGIAQFQLGAQDRSLLTGFVLSRVEREGVPQPRTVEIKPGEDISGLKIVVVYGSGIVRGIIKVENAPLPAGARLMVRLTKPEDPTFMVRPGEVDARGRFAVEGVPAGAYDLYANLFVPGSRARQPSAKQSITVTDGSVTDVEVTLDLDANSPPRP